MALVKKPPVTVEPHLPLKEPVSRLLDDYGRFVDGTPDYVASALKKLGARDPEHKKWKASQSGTSPAKEMTAPPHAARTT